MTVKTLLRLLQLELPREEYSSSINGKHCFTLVNRCRLVSEKQRRERNSRARRAWDWFRE